MAAPQLTSALAQGSLEPGEVLPLKLKWILRREFWPQFQNLLKQGTEVGGTQLSQYWGMRVLPQGHGPVVRGMQATTLVQGHTDVMEAGAHGVITPVRGHVDATVSPSVQRQSASPLGHGSRWEGTAGRGEDVPHQPPAVLGSGRQPRDPGAWPHTLSVPAAVALRDPSAAGTGCWSLGGRRKLR